MIDGSTALALLLFVAAVWWWRSELPVNGKDKR